jgi:hypothetical protein
MACKRSAVRSRLAPPLPVRPRAPEPVTPRYSEISRPYPVHPCRPMVLRWSSLSAGDGPCNLPRPAQGGGRGARGLLPTTVPGASPSSRGPGHRPFTAVTGVRIPLGTPINQSVTSGDVAQRGSRSRFVQLQPTLRDHQLPTCQSRAAWPTCAIRKRETLMKRAAGDGCRRQRTSADGSMRIPYYNRQVTEDRHARGQPCGHFGGFPRVLGPHGSLKTTTHRSL